MEVATTDPWEQLCRLFTALRGWAIQAQSTPGSEPAWCFSLDGETKMSISVDGNGYSVYLVEEDEERPFADLPTAAVWLDAQIKVYEELAAISNKGKNQPPEEPSLGWRPTPRR